MSRGDDLILSAIMTAIIFCKNPQKLKQYKLLLKAAYCFAEIEEVGEKGGGDDGPKNKPEN